jgi:hypothetical protein
MRFRFLLAFLLCCFGGTAGADSTPPGPAMWVVKHGDSTVYLLGTIHVLKAGTDWQSEKLTAAFKASGEYWMEADIDGDQGAAQTYALNFGSDPEHPLKEKLSATQYDKLASIARDYNLPLGQLDPLRPWLASVVLGSALTKKIGFDPKNGVDITLEHEAKDQGKPVKTFETPTEQFGFFVGLPPKIEADLLMETMDEIAGGGELIDAMEQAWIAGDAKKMQQLGFAGMKKQEPQLYDVIINRRNHNWVKQIETMLKGSGTIFIAVGAGHLIGPDSVPALLQADGYKVQRF